VTLKCLLQLHYETNVFLDFSTHGLTSYATVSSSVCDTEVRKEMTCRGKRFSVNCMEKATVV
jgi:hypothetical protein